MYILVGGMHRYLYQATNCGIKTLQHLYPEAALYLQQ